MLSTTLTSPLRSLGNCILDAMDMANSRAAAANHGYFITSKKKIWNILSKVFTRLCKEEKRTLDISAFDCISLFIMMRGVRACVCV